MKIYNGKFLKIIFIIVAVLSALCFGASVILLSDQPRGASADGEYQAFLPNKSEEYYALNSPIHAYSDFDITAVTLNDKKLIISKNSAAPSEIVFADDLGGQVSRFGNYLIYRKSQTMYGININDTDDRPALYYIDGLDNPAVLTCNSHFYYDDGSTKLFVASVENKLRVYNVTDDDGKPLFLPMQELLDNPVTINDNSPVTVNGSSVFYINGDGRLCRRRINSLMSGDEYATTIIPTSSMIADDEFVYYIAANKIYRLTINDTSAVPQELSFIDEGYDLGVVSNPKGLAFKGNNFLITNFSANGSVQEFKINGDTLQLEFTGYAIASGLSAYNRVATNSTNIERYGNSVAALDGKKLTVIDTDACADYNKNGFINKFVDNAPEKFALGNGTLLYASGTNVYISGVAADTEENAKQITGLPDGAPNYITYQSGAYYLIYLGTNSKIVKIDETTGAKVQETEFTGVAANVIAVDVFKNIYVAYNDKVYKNSGSTVFNLPSNAKKLATDLAGNLFALTENGKIYKLGANADAFALAFDVTDTLGTIKTFGMDFDCSEIYFLINGKEEIFFTSIAGNVALEDFIPNDDFRSATTGKRELKVYTASDSANVYSVTAKPNAFDFNGLTEKSSEYPLIAKLTVSDVTLCALASQNGVVLINENELTEKVPTPAQAPEKAFLTTSVYAYAIPVIEKSGAFTIVFEDNKIKLDKGATVKVNGAFTLLDKIFYDATATINGEDLTCYIPADFTATVLSENFEFESYTVEKVKSTTLYKNVDLTEEILQLGENETVKLLERKDGALKVAITTQDGTVIGYIAENSLIENPSTIVRNVLIILAVFGSLAGTISYFLLRKKR